MRPAENFSSLPPDPGYTSRYTKMYGLYFDKILQYARQFPGDTESILQDVFVSWYERREPIDFSKPDDLEKQLYTRVRNRYISLYRKRKTENKTMEALIDFLDVENLSDWEQAETDAEYTAKLAFIMKEIDKLPKKSRQLLMAIIIDGLTTQECANKYGIGEQSVRNLRAKAVNKLRGRIKDSHLLILLIIISLFEGPWKN